MDAELWVYLEGFLSAEPPPPPPAGFVQIPAGSFLMGAPADELGSRIDERPQHTVTLTRSFYPQSTKVTNQQHLEGHRPESCGKPQMA